MSQWHGDAAGQRSVGAHSFGLGRGGLESTQPAQVVPTPTGPAPAGEEALLACYPLASEPAAEVRGKAVGHPLSPD